MDNSTASAWQCPAGLTVDSLSRFSGCTIGIDLAQFLGWYILTLFNASALLWLFAAIKLHLHDPTSSPARVQGLAGAGIGMIVCTSFMGFPAVDPHTPASSDGALSFAHGLGFLLLAFSLWKYAGQNGVGIFQMVYSLEQAKSNEWTRRLNLLAMFSGGGHGSGMLIVFIGCHFARDQKGTDAALIAGFACTSMTLFVVSSVGLYGYLELRGLQKVISADSSTGKTLKKLSLLVLFTAISVGNWAVCNSLIVVIPWMRHRAGTLWVLMVASAVPLNIAAYVYELQQLGKRQAAQKQRCQIKPTDNSDSHQTTSAIADTVAATQQALQRGNRTRRDPSVSLVLDSGVSLAFLETFFQENSIGDTMTANDAVAAHVKPHTKEIGLNGTGAYVELIGDGVDSDGRRWCGTPTHMFSYSWSYSIRMIVAGLRQFEDEHPPSKGQCHYYFIDQFVSARTSMLPASSLTYLVSSLFMIDNL
jgi:hypothetical protein